VPRRERTVTGEIDLDKDDDPPPGYEKAEIEVVHKLAKEKKAKDATRTSRGEEAWRVGLRRELWGSFVGGRLRILNVIHKGEII